MRVSDFEEGDVGGASAGGQCGDGIIAGAPGRSRSEKRGLGPGFDNGDCC